jgi:site-specific DNA-methyltransferase (adenine-specific)
VESNLEMFEQMLPAFHHTLKDSGFCILWCDYDRWEHLKALAAKAGFQVQRWPIVWVKMHTCLNQMAHVNFTKNTEIALVLRKGKARLPRPVQTSIVMASNDEDKAKYGHPFVKPFEVWKFLIESVSIQGETILDPFAGVGSSTMAALQLGRKPIAVEIEEGHHAKLMERVKEFYREKIPNVDFTV